MRPPTRMKSRSDLKNEEFGLVLNRYRPSRRRASRNRTRLSRKLNSLWAAGAPASGSWISSRRQAARYVPLGSPSLRACLKSRMRGHSIVGVMTISTDVDKRYDTDLTDAAWTLIA